MDLTELGGRTRHITHYRVDSPEAGSSVPRYLARPRSALLPSILVRRLVLHEALRDHDVGLLEVRLWPLQFQWPWKFLSWRTLRRLHSHDEFGFAPLHYAVRIRSIRAASVLIAAGSWVDVPDSLGRTPLFFAARSGQKLMCELLCELGADPSIEDATGTSALDLGASKAWPSREFFLNMRLAEIKRSRELRREKNSTNPAPLAKAALDESRRDRLERLTDKGIDP